jgi:hypothetical protein
MATDYPEHLLARDPAPPHQSVGAIGQEPVDDLMGRHAQADIELRITPSIWPFWRQVASSTVGFSGSRLRNAAPHPDQFD